MIQRFVSSDDGSLHHKKRKIKNDNSNIISDSNSERVEKMTNEMIILMEQIRLYDEGILTGTGRKLKVTFNDGVKEIEEIEPIHTYQYWKNHGFQVQKGEKAITQIMIWKHVINKKKNSDDEEEERMFMKRASFFKSSQVKAIK